MSLYRLDYMADNGTLMPVADPLLGGDYLAHHMATARNYARLVAADDGIDVLVTRIGNAGAMKPTIIIHPDGSASRPPGSKPVSERDDCVKRAGRTCFCTPCRADRRS